MGKATWTWLSEDMVWITPISAVTVEILLLMIHKCITKEDYSD
jgi:hypothetical protein